MGPSDLSLQPTPSGAAGRSPADGAQPSATLTDATPRSLQATPRIAVLVSDLMQPANREFVDGVVAALEGQAVTSVAIPMGALMPDLCAQLLAELAGGAGWDGIVLRSNGSDPGDGPTGWAAQLQAAVPQIPVVTVGVALKGARRIVPDVEDGVRQAVQHLVAVHARRRFAFVRRAAVDEDGARADPDQPDPDRALAALSRAWEQAYRDSLSAHGIDADAALVVDVRDGADGVYDAVASLLKQDPLVDAIIVSEAAMAVGVCNAIRAHALGIPEDTAVIVLQPGETTSQLAAPTLTTVAPLERSLGAHAASALLRAISKVTQEGDPDGQWEVDGLGRSLSEVDELMPAELVLGRSCGCAPRTDTIAAPAAVEAVSGPSAPAGTADYVDLAALDFARAAMGKVSLTDLSGVMERHFAQMGIEHALLSRLALSPEGRASEPHAAPIPAFHARLVLTYVGGHAVLRDDVDAIRMPLVASAPEAPASSVLQPLVCDGQLLGLLQLGPWRGDAPMLSRSLADSVAGLLFREDRLLHAERLLRRTEHTREREEVTRRIVDRANRATDEQAALRTTLEGLGAYLSATHCAARLGDRAQLAAHGKRMEAGGEDGNLTPGGVQDVWLPVMSEAVRTAQLVRAVDAEGRPALGVPLTRLDREVSGVLGFAGESAAEPWSPEQVSLVESVVAQVSQTLETRRLAAEAERRASRLAAAAEVSRAATAMTELSTLLPDVVDLICERFELAYVGLFLIDDPQEWAVLIAGTGDAGQAMLAQGHRLAVGGQSMIGACVADGQARRAADTGLAEVWRPNPMLPAIRSELALPLVTRGRVIGAMTVQDEVPDAFSEEDITILQTLADQLANAIENARLLERMNQSLRELRAATGDFTEASWRDYVKRRQTGLGYRRRALGVTQTAERNPEAKLALERGESVVLPLDGHAPVSSPEATADDVTDSVPAETTGAGVGVPIRLRNQVLGVLNLRFQDDFVPPETVQLIEQVADRLAVSLETARLLEVTQRTAQRERVVATLTQRMRESLEVDEVLARSAREIREALDLFKVSVRLAPGTSPSAMDVIDSQDDLPAASTVEAHANPEDAS